jgi:hypothetical protein
MREKTVASPKGSNVKNLAAQRRAAQVSKSLASRKDS